MNFDQQSKVSLGLHLFSVPLLLNSLSLTYFSFQSESRPHFGITLSSLKFEFPLENSSTFSLSSSFQSVSEHCSSTSRSLFDDLCPFMTGFSMGGWLYTVFTIIVSICCVNTATGIWWIIRYKKQAKFDSTSFLSSLVYLAAICSYLLIASVYSPECKSSNGVAWAFLIEIYLILLTFHYNFYLKPEFSQQFSLLERLESRIEVKETNLSPFVIQSKVANETYQSEDEAPKLTQSKRKASCQSIQVDGEALDSTISNQLTQEIQKLIEQKKFLERSTGQLKDLLSSSAPDVSLYQSKIEVKTNEILNLKEIISNLKDKLVQKDLMLSEAEREVTVYKTLADSLSANNSILNKNIEEKEKLIDNFRSSGNFKSFEDVSESAKHDFFSSNDRYTESTQIGSLAPSDRDSTIEKIQFLTRALEIQKEINDQLNTKNRRLEESSKRLSEAFEPSKPSETCQNKEKKFNEMTEKILQVKEKLKSSKSIVEAQLVKIQNLKSENEDLSCSVQSYQDKCKTFEDMYLDVSSKLIKDKNEWELEKEDLLYSKTLMKREIESLNSRLKLQESSLNQEILNLTHELDRLRDQVNLYQAEHSAAKSELDNLREIHSIISEKFSESTPDYIHLSPERLSNLLQIEPRYERTITDLDKSFHSVLSEKEDLRKSLMEKESALQELSEMNQRLNQQLFVLKEQPHRPSTSSRSEGTLNSMPSETSSLNSALSVQEMMIIESLGGVDFRSNPLIDKVSKLKKEPPMIYSNLWKLLEKLMQEKTKVDKMDLALKRKPRAMFEFVADFFLSHFGLQTLANRQLKAMTTSLEELHRVSHPYGVFFSRLLGIYHPRPLPPELACFLMMVQHLFGKVVAGNTGLSFAQHYEVLQYGGNASIVDVMEIVMKVCKMDRTVGERVIFSIHKDSDRKLEISLLKACGTLAKMNSDPESVFELLDSNNTGSLDYHEFVDGIRYTLGIWISQEEAEDICAYLDKDSNGNVTVEEWADKIDFDEFRRKVKEPSAFVTKVEVLNAFIEEYELEMVEDYNKLRQKVRCRNLGRDDFIGFVKGIDSEFKEHEIIKMFERLRKDENTNYVSAEGACLSVMKNKVGGFGVGIFDLDKVVDLN